MALAILSTLWFRTKFSITRELPRFATAGMPLDYRVTVQNQSRREQRGLSLYEDLAFSWPSREEFRVAREPGVRRNWLDRALGYYAWTALLAERRNAEIEGAKVPVLQAIGTTSITLRLVPKKRGRVSLAGASVARTDPLGLARVVSRVVAPQTLLVLPKRYQLPPLSLPGQRRHQPGGARQDAGGAQPGQDRRTRHLDR